MTLTLFFDKATIYLEILKNQAYQKTPIDATIASRATVILNKRILPKLIKLGGIRIIRPITSFYSAIDVKEARYSFSFNFNQTL